MSQTCDATLDRIGREIARAWKGQQSDEDALVAIDEALANADDERDRARHTRFAPAEDADEPILGGQGDSVAGKPERPPPEPDGDEEHAPDPQRPDGSPADGGD